MENLENRENIDKTTIKSRLKSYGKKILEAGKRSTKEKAKKAVVWSSIVLTILNASSDLSPVSQKEIAETFKKESKKQELVLNKKEKTSLENIVLEKNKTFEDIKESKIIVQEANEKTAKDAAENNTEIQQPKDILEEQNPNNPEEITSEKSEGEKKHINSSEMFQENSEIVLGKEEFQHLFRHAKEVGIETSQERIETELNLLKSVSDVLNENYKLKAGESGEFRMAERAKSQIEEANEIFERIFENQESKNNKIDSLDKGKISWESIIEAIPLFRLSQNIMLIRHELGHEEAAKRQGVESKGIKIDLLSTSGFCRVNTSLGKSPAAIWGGGIEATRSLADFVLENLRGSDNNNQIAALIILASRFDGFSYALRTTLGLDKSSGNDILGYTETSKEKDLTPEKILLGMSAGFFLDSDNLALFKMGLGDKNIRLSDKFWKVYYKLGKEAPEMGVKAGFKF